LVLEHLAGGTLAGVLAANRSKQHTFPFDDALYRLRELASALDYLHRFHPGATIIHRDLKVLFLFHFWSDDGGYCTTDPCCVLCV